MQKIRTRSELMRQIAQLRAENKRLQGTIDDIADIVNDEDSQDETGHGGRPEEDEAEEEDFR